MSTTPKVRGGGGGKRDTPDPDDKKTRTRHPKPGDIASLRRVLWAAIRKVEAITETGDPDIVLRAVSALSTCAGVYIKCAAEHDFERGLSELREELHDATAALGRSQGEGTRTRSPDVN